MLAIVIFLVWIAALVGVLFVGPGWLFVWELRKGRTVPPFRVERAQQPGRYWLCIAAHALLWLLWILVCVVLVLFWILMQPGFYN